MSDELVLLATGSGHFGVAYRGEPIKAFSFGISVNDDEGHTAHATINEVSARELLEFLKDHLEE